MSFIPNDKEPVYIQIIRYIKQQIVIGELGIGDIIPSRRDMAVMIKVNPNTVQKHIKKWKKWG
ncbi:GntR family transcriptional regulator [Paraclostridium bifermentans]|nr:GntR family transcriptional regulator [Paraclostridium bifermentans]